MSKEWEVMSASSPFFGFLSLRRHDPDQVQRVLLMSKSQASGHPEESRIVYRSWIITR